MLGIEALQPERRRRSHGLFHSKIIPRGLTRVCYFGYVSIQLFDIGSHGEQIDVFLLHADDIFNREEDLDIHIQNTSGVQQVGLHVRSKSLTLIRPKVVGGRDHPTGNQILQYCSVVYSQLLMGYGPLAPLRRYVLAIECSSLTSYSLRT